MDFLNSAPLPYEKQPTLNTLHRKIDLQSPADLHYLQRNLARAARERLDLHFPNINGIGTSQQQQQHQRRRHKPATVISLDGARRDSQLDGDDNDKEQQNQVSRGIDKEKGREEETVEEDPLRRSVRLLVDEFLRATYQNAAHSISVNGIDAPAVSATSFPSCSNPDPSTDEFAATSSTATDEETAIEEKEGVHFTYAPFDAKLQRKVAGLHGQLETLTAEVARLRREAPRKAATAYIARLEETLSREDEEWLRVEESLEAEQEGYTGLELDLGSLGKQNARDWNREVKEIYDVGVRKLGALSGAVQDGREKSLTETVGKVQRARTVALELE